MNTKLETLIADLEGFCAYPRSRDTPARFTDALINTVEYLRQADQQAQPVAWLKEWADVSYPDDYDHRRVDLTPDCEAWLQAKNPKLTPLFTSPPAQPQVRELTRSELEGLFVPKGHTHGISDDEHDRLRAVIAADRAEYDKVKQS